MNIKSLLLGSAAALAAVSGAQAADAIVAAEPEPMEYVRVCDAFGTGYFYIPGTETCLKISGSVRFAYDWSDDSNDANDDFTTRARVEFTTASDSEIGTIGSYIRLEGTSDASDNVGIEQAYITVGGFKAGYSVTFWDDVGIAGENDAFTSFTKGDMVSYTYSTDAFTVGLGVDELTDVGFNDLGVEAMASASLGAATISLYGVYDFDAEEGAISAKVAAGVGPGTFELYGAYASDVSAYASTAEWTVGAAYAFKATEKLVITPSINYWDGLASAGTFGSDSQWGAGVLVEYNIASGLDLSTTVDYREPENADGNWTGFVRLVRSF
jgi:hypothetical protein